MSTRTGAVIFCAVIAVLAAWMLRWEITPVPAQDNHPSYAYALDRWTGKIWFMQQDGRMEMRVVERPQSK